MKSKPLPASGGFAFFLLKIRFKIMGKIYKGDAEY